jgi:hypothetical protein
MFQVIFSDETMVQLNRQSSQFVRRRPGEPIREIHTQQNKTFAKKIMFWGCISSHGPGILIPVHGTLNAERYCALLEQHLLPQAALWYGDGLWEFQQDNAPSHKAHTTMAFFADNSIEVLEWPAYSPDINPIENLWSTLKKKIYHSGSASTIQGVITQALHLWHHDTEIHAQCVSLCTNMSTRVQKLRNARGGPIFS